MNLRSTAMALLCGLLCAGTVAEAKGRVSVKGYTRADGTRVAPYTRSSPSGGGSGVASTPGKPCGNSYISSIYTCGGAGTNNFGGSVNQPQTNFGQPATGMPAALRYNSYSQAIDAEGRVISMWPLKIQFRNCDDARSRGFSDMPYGSAGYAIDLDTDNDGIACESGGADGNRQARQYADPGYLLGTIGEMMTVTMILDGRTVVLADNTSEREYTLLGLDTPRPAGKALLRSFLPIGSNVKVATQAGTAGVYIWKEMKFVNWEMLNLGSPHQELPANYDRAAELNTTDR